MRPWLRPTQLAARVWEIDLQALSRRGVRAAILDLDNTLVDWNRSEVRPQVRDWLETARQRGFGLCLVSNAVRGKRVRMVCQELGLPAVIRAGKPLARAFRRGLAVLGTRAEETCAIGDQVFTDILGANRLGLVTILLEPLNPRESPHTRLLRLVERPLRRRWLCSGPSA